MDAYVKHREGIDNVMLYWKTGIDDPYQSHRRPLPTTTCRPTFSPAAGTMYYYLRGEANDGGANPLDGGSRWLPFLRHG